MRSLSFTSSLAPALVFLALAGPVRADDTTVALATLVGHTGRVSDGAVFAFRSGQVEPSGRLSVLGTIIAPSPEPCVFEVTEGWQPPYANPSALVTQRRYDLRRLAAVEFLRMRLDTTGPSAAPRAEVVPRDDPNVRGVRLRGPGLRCSRRFSLTDGGPRYSSECEDELDVWDFQEDERQRALASLLAACPVR